MSHYASTVPVWIEYLGHYEGILKKGEAWAKENGKTDEEMINAKLHEDMLPLWFQAEVLAFLPRGGAKGLGRIFKRDRFQYEKTWAGLQSLNQDTINILKTIKPEDMDGKDGISGMEYEGVGHYSAPTHKWVHEYLMPNFFFHLSTAYGILRQMGVPLGKRDYQGDVVTFTPLKA